MIPQRKKPNSLISFLLPYLMMAAAVLTFVWLVFFSNPLGQVVVPATNLGEFLMEENVTQVTTVERETVTTVSGTYVNGEGETVVFTATLKRAIRILKMR